MVAGVVLMFNLAPPFLTGGNLAFSAMSGKLGTMFTLMLRLVIAPALIIIPGYVIYNIIRG